MHKSGFVNIIGNPNVGKSTLMNALVGEKLSIITSKAQTTRHRIMGIVSGEDFQIVYSDTPGILKPSYKLQESMMKFVTGAVTETSFNPTAKFEEAFIERKDYEYSYNDGDLYYFMDQETYDMVPVSKDMLDDSFKFIKENTPVKLLSYKGNVFSVETPNFVELTVTKADPGVKGDTATNVTKPATVETGAEIKVPLFINEGEKIQIDTRTGEYLGRVKG